jgi:hypothetical protein
MALGESKSGNLQNKAASGNSEANKAMRDASAQEIKAAKERIELAQELIALGMKEADSARDQAAIQRKMASEGHRTRAQRLQYLKEEKKFLKEAEKHEEKAAEYAEASIGFEEDILALREKNKKVTEDQHKVNTEISNQMTGSMGKFKGMVESLPLGKIVSQQANLGGLMEQTQKKVTASLNQSFKDGEGGIQAYARAGAIAMRGLGMAIRAAMGPLGLIALLVAAIVMIIKHAIKATDQARKFSKQLGVAADEGARLQQQFGTFNGEKGIEAMTAMKEQLGFNTRLSQESANAMGVFMNHASMANGDLGKIAGNAALIGSDFAEIAGAAGEFASETTGELDILKEIASLSKDTVGHFVGRTKEMVRQAKLAKDMNLSLEKTMSVSKGLLDIESSIESEMTARLLTGKELNFDAARQLALQGDSAGAAKAITDQVGSLEGMDMIQLDALAQATGLSVGELQGTAQKAEDKDKGKLLKAATATTQMKDVMQEIKDRWMQRISGILDSIVNSQLFKDISAFVLKHLDVILMGIAATLLIIAATNVVGSIRKLGRGFGKNVKGLGKGMSKSFKVLGKGTGLITKAIGSLGGIFSSGISSLASAFKASVKKPKVPKPKAKGNMFTRGYNAVKSVGKAAINKVKTGANVVKTGVQKGYTAVKQGGAKVINKVKDMSPKNMFGNLFKGKTFGVIKKFLKGSGILNVLLELAEVGMIMATDMPKREKSRELVRAGSSVIGSLMGGGLGSLLGPVGTFLGSIGGSMLGNWVGSMPAVQDKLAPFIEGLLPDDNGKAEDFIVQDNKLTKFRKDDIIIGGTNLGGGDQDSKIVERLDKLIELMMEGKTIEMDGVKVAQALSLNNLDVGVA